MSDFKKVFAVNLHEAKRDSAWADIPWESGPAPGAPLKTPLVVPVRNHTPEELGCTKPLSGDGWEGLFGGNVPVQGFGTLDGYEFYFRARGTSWTLYVAKSSESIYSGWSISRTVPGNAYSAGWMSLNRVRRYMRFAAEQFRKRSSDTEEA